jgi:hypothetical protein
MVEKLTMELDDFEHFVSLTYLKRLVHKFIEYRLRDQVSVPDKIDEGIFAHIDILCCFHAVDHRTEVVLWQVDVAELI